MKILSSQEMGSVEGGASLFALNTVSAKTDTVVDPFMDNMKKMFGATAGRDLAKAAKKFGLVGIVNAIFGW
ncbi:hypothetical protein [Leclercia sp.]|uniref:hypothetical protein n=1 Tax=Leclercia sp. TaxID=1898428 RepID=UPI002FDF0034